MPSSKACLIEVSRYECCLPLTLAQWNNLQALNADTLDDDKLFAEAVKAGVIRGTFDYSGHFGSYLYFTTESQECFPAVQAAIFKVIGGT